jgi:hypothetical protein
VGTRQKLICVVFIFALLERYAFERVRNVATLLDVSGRSRTSTLWGSDSVSPAGRADDSRPAREAWKGRE